MENRHAHARPPDAPACRLCRRRGRCTRPHRARSPQCAPSGQAAPAWLLPPSAESVASRPDAAFWSAPDLPEKVSAKQTRLVTKANLKWASPRLRLIKAGAEVAPGVTTFDTAGHTPGHISVNISSGREEMLLTGDVVVNSAASFLHPEWPFGVDLDVPQATKTPTGFLHPAAADKT